MKFIGRCLLGLLAWLAYSVAIAIVAPIGHYILELLGLNYNLVVLGHYLCFGAIWLGMSWQVLVYIATGTRPDFS